MANIIDYTKKYNNVPINEMGFNELDGLVLSQLANFDWTDIVPELGDRSDITVQEAINMYFDLGRDSTMKEDSNARELLLAIKDGDRYGKMTIGNFKTEFVEKANAASPEDIEQFAAVTISYKDSAGSTQNVVSFRGTDGTLEGWNEDFNMAFDLHTEAQKASADYLNKVGNELEGDLRLAGHSKGANDATYSYLYCNDEVRDRVVKIYSYDGPGLPRETAKNKNYNRMIELMNGSAIAPYDSVIGLLLFENGFVFVDTNKNIIEDHDAYSWQIDVDNAKFIEREQSFKSKFINAAFDNYLAFLPYESRKLLIISIFDFIYSDVIKDYNGDGKNFDDVIEYFKDRKLGFLVDVWNSDIPISDKIMIYSGIIVAIPVVLFSLIETAIEEFINAVISFGEKLVSMIVSVIDSVVSWTKEKLQQFKNCIKEAYNTVKNAIKDFWNKHFNSGYKEASAHPQAELDTVSLETYAQRLQSVNRRIARIDQRLDDLYWQVGLADLWSLMQADILTKYSKRLEKSVGYLYDTAGKYKKCENELIDSM